MATITTAPSLINNRERLPKCIVCYKKIKRTDEVVVLTCNIHHIYHKKCIKYWFKTSDECPRCKIEVISQAQANHNKEAVNTMF